MSKVQTGSQICDLNFATDYLHSSICSSHNNNHQQTEHKNCLPRSEPESVREKRKNFLFQAHQSSSSTCLRAVSTAGRIKMYARSAAILTACVICTFLLLVIFMFLHQFTQPDCDLIFIESSQLRSKTLNSWAKDSPRRSKDKSMLLKVAASLEYILEPKSSVQLLNQSLQASQQQQQQNHQQPSSVIVGQSPLALQVTNQQFGGPKQVQTIAQTANQAHQQTQNTSSPASVISSQSKEKDSSSREKRFLILDAFELKSKKLEDNRYEYTVSFDCAKMTMTFVRKPDKVHVEQIKIDLKTKSRKKSTCELQLPAQGAFSVDVHDNLAHYYCDRPLTYSCMHYSSKHPNEAGLHLADLHIHGIEFETVSNTSRISLKSKDFSSERSKCL